MTAAPLIETERLVLRPHRMEDFPPFAAFYASEGARFIGGPMDDRRAWHVFAADVGGWELMGFGGWAIEEKASGAFAGQVALSKPPHFPEREIGWLLLPGFERRGYATEGARAVRAYAYGELGLGHGGQLRRSRQRAVDRGGAAARLRRGPGGAAHGRGRHRLPPSRPGGARMTAAPRIETERLVLRPHRMEDFARHRRLLRHATRRASSAGRCRGRAAWYGFAADVGSWDLLGFGAWAIEENATGAFVGQVGLSQAAALPRARDRLAAPSRLRAPRLRHRGRPRRPRLRLRHARLDDRRQLRRPRQHRARSRVARRLGCTEDPAAAPLDPEDLVFRHPAPEALPMTRSDAIRRAADLLRGHRESIDRLDAILVFTLAERFKHTQAVGVLKARARAAAVRPGARSRCRSPGSSGWPRRRTSIRSSPASS